MNVIWTLHSKARMDKSSVYVLPDILCDFPNKPDLIQNDGENEQDGLLKVIEEPVQPSAPLFEEVTVNSETSWTLDEQSSVQKTNYHSSKENEDKISLSCLEFNGPWYKPCGKGLCWWPLLTVLWVIFGALFPLMCIIWLFCSVIRDPDYDDDD